MIKRISIIVLLLLALLSTLVASPPSWTPITGTVYSMVLIADIQLDGAAFSGEGENIAAAFGPGGESDCRSIGIWYPSTINHDAYWYFTIRANINYETISFRIYNEADDEIYLSEDTINFLNNSNIGTISAPHLISFTSTVPALPAPENVTLALYPSAGFFILSWDQVPEADMYNIFGGVSPEISSGTLLDQTINTNWVGIGIPGSKKFFWVTSVSNSVPANQDNNYVPKNLE